MSNILNVIRKCGEYKMRIMLISLSSFLLLYIANIFLILLNDMTLLELKDFLKLIQKIKIPIYVLILKSNFYRQKYQKCENYFSIISNPKEDDHNFSSECWIMVCEQ